MTRKYLLCGDLHNDLKCAERVIEHAVANDVDEIISVGDWGFLWPGRDQIYSLANLLVKHRMQLRFCDGNHDDHHRLRQAPSGDHNIAPNITYQPRGSVYEDEDGTRFLFVGGAPSIDRAGRTPGLDWWPEEEISEKEFYTALAVLDPIHVLITHDAAVLPPGFSTDVGDPVFERSAKRSRQIIQGLIDKFSPLFQIHGHFHVRYTRMISGTVVHGLASNHQPLDQLTLLWQRELP